MSGNHKHGIKADFLIQTDKALDEIEKRARALEPWRVRVRFSNGFDTGILKRTRLWNEQPLAKLRSILNDAGEEVFRGARVLDVGSNVGYNTLTLSQRFGASVTGIDNSARNIEKAEFLAWAAGTTVKYQRADATTYIAGPFDVVLHLGTLYHLLDPITAMRTAAQNTRDGGVLFLETAGYEGRDPLDARLIFNRHGDKSNAWALGIGAIQVILEDCGFRNVAIINKQVLSHQKGTGLCRLLLRAQK